MPVIASTPALLVLLVIGALLFAFGGGIARGGFLFCASLIGYALGSTVAGWFEASWLETLVVAMLCSAAAFMLARTMFRLWVGMTSAMMLAIGVPMLVLVFLPAEPLPDDRLAPEVSAVDAENESEPQTVSPEAAAWVDLTPEQREAAAQVAQDMYIQMRDAVSAIWSREAEPFQQWWEAHSPARRRNLGMVALMAGLAGLVMALMMPLRAVALQTSTLGSILLFVAGTVLLERFAPGVAAWIPQSDIGIGLLLVVMIAIGFGLQHGEAKPQVQPVRRQEPAKASGN